MDDDLNEDLRFRNRWVGYAAIAILLIGCLVIFVPVYNSARPAAPRAACLSNLKQIAVAFAIYTTDNDDRFPPADWQTASMPYTKSTTFFSCPTVAHDGYGMNSAWLEKRAPDQPRPLLFETDALGKSVVMNMAGRNKDRHSGWSNVTYTDLSTRSVSARDDP